jgi:hypothetical protein
MRPLLRVTLSTLALLTFAVCGQPAAQGAIPSNWQELSAEALLESVKETIQAEGEAFAEREQVAAHVWRQYLQDPAFIAGADWEVARSLAILFGDADVAVGETTSGELRSELVAGLSGRLRSDEDLLGGFGVYSLGAETKRLERLGATASDTADAFAAWMDHNDWSEFDLASLYNLYSWVSADAVDRRHFSARWTGSITAPRTGEYTLRQIQQYSGTNSQLLVTIGGQAVLDSRDKEQGPERFESRSVTLAGGESTPIVVEMRHDVSRIDYSEGAPMVVVTWESAGLTETIIPSSAYSPPEGFGGEASGLQGEYFAGMDFDDLKVTRLDPALDIASSWPPIAPVHQAKSSAVLSACVEKLISASFLETAAEEGHDEVFSHLMWRIAYRMSATQRERLVETLLASPHVLAKLTPEAVGRLYEGIYFLPSGPEFLAAWSLERPQPRCQPGVFPGWSEGSYQQVNLDYYWLIGRFLQGPYTEDAEQLLSDYLERDGGECNLAIAYILAFAGKDRSMREVLLRRIADQLDQDGLSGDIRATWLIAKAFAEEVPPVAGRPRPLRGLRSLETALDGAQSADAVAWVTQEIAARMIAQGETDSAKALVQQRQADFISVGRGETAALLVQAAESAAARNAERRAARSEEADQLYKKELERRRVKGDSGRLDALLDGVAR